MAFKQWFEILGHDISADSKDKNRYSSVDLSKTRSDGNSTVSLSPITNDLLNFWTQSLFSDNNLILIFPENMIRPIPLLSYIHSRITSKSTLVFTSGSVNLKDHITKLHNQNYQLMRYAGSDYLYNIAPIGILKGNSIKYVPYLLHASNAFKRDNKERLKQNLISSDKPKILLNDSKNLMGLTDVVTNVVFDNKEIENLNIELDVGCIIFENADRFLNSRFLMEFFIDWSKNAIDNNVNFLFHFSKPKRDFLTDFKNKTNSLVLDFNANLLHNNVISRFSKDYFNNHENNLFILDNYNLDLFYNHYSTMDVSIAEPILKNGNLDLYEYHAQKIIDAIEENSLRNKWIYTLSIKLLYALPNLAISPSFYVTHVMVSRDKWMNLSIPNIINFARQEARKENGINQILLNKLLSNISNIYYELVKCKNYFEDNNFSRVSKGYKILEIAHTKKDYFREDKELLIGTYQKTEEKVLNDFLSDIDDVNAIYLNKLYRKSEDFSNFNLLLPGIINYKFTSILEQNFNQILILAYQGRNESLINQQIEEVLNYSIFDEKVSMDYFEELYEKFNLSKNNIFFKEFNMRYKKAIINQEKNDVGEDNILSNGDIASNYSDYVKNQRRAESNILDSVLSNK